MGEGGSIPGIEVLLELVLQQFPFVFVFSAKVNRVAHFVIIVVVRGPQNGLIAFLKRALRWLFESQRRAALSDNHAGNVWRRRRPERHSRRLTRRYAGLTLRPYTGILQRDSVDDRRDVARQIGQADPINAVSRPAVVDDGLPLNEPRRWRFHGAARFRIGAVPAGPLTAGVLGVSRADKKFQ